MFILGYIFFCLLELIHAIIGCGKQGFPSAQPYLSDTEPHGLGVAIGVDVLIMIIAYFATKLLELS